MRLVTTCLYLKALPRLTQERDQLKEELQRLREEKHHTRELLQRVREERDGARVAKERLESKVALLQERYDRLSHRVKYSFPHRTSIHVLTIHCYLHQDCALVSSVPV